MIEFGKQGHYTWSFSKRKKIRVQIFNHHFPISEKIKNIRIVLLWVAAKPEPDRLTYWVVPQKTAFKYIKAGGSYHDWRSHRGKGHSDGRRLLPWGLRSKNSCSDRSGQLLSLSRFFLLGVLKWFSKSTLKSTPKSWGKRKDLPPSKKASSIYWAFIWRILFS